MIKKAVVWIVCILGSPMLWAQDRYGGYVDSEKIHFGFSFHYVQSTLKLIKASDWGKEVEPWGNLTDLYAPSNHGVGIGLLADAKLGQYFNLRFTPNILFADKSIKYEFIYEKDQPDERITDISKPVKASLVELPLALKYKSERKRNYRLYVLAGPKYSINVVPKSKLDDSDKPEEEKFVKLKREFLSYEFGIGCDIYFDWFKMSPEIRWSQSFGNILDKETSHRFNTPIDKMLLRSLQFSLIFE